MEAVGLLVGCHSVPAGMQFEAVVSTGADRSLQGGLQKNQGRQLFVKLSQGLRRFLLVEECAGQLQESALETAWLSQGDWQNEHAVHDAVY